MMTILSQPMFFNIFSMTFKYLIFSVQSLYFHTRARGEEISGTITSSEKLGIRNGLLLIHMPIYLSQGRQPWISNITFSCLGKMKSFKDQTAVVKKPVFLESIRFEHY